MSEEDTPNAAPASPPPTPPPAAPPPVPTEVSSDERTWALIGHLSSFAAFITGGIGCVIGPLVVWLIKRDTMPFVADQAKEALNFNITLAIAMCALFLFSIVTFGIGLILAWPIAAVLAVAWFVLTIIAALKANEGVAYRYPFTLRLVK